MAFRLKIIIFDGTFKTTAFINRLITGLVKSHDVYVLGFNDTLITPIQGVRYVKLGSNSSKWGLINTSLSIGLTQHSIKGLFSTILHIVKFNRKALQNQNLKWVIDTINPDVIHAQWVSNIHALEPILTENKYPVVLSQRGYHINVRSFIDQENMAYLKQWFPKMAGFHSVSKAMSKNGNLIFNHPSKIDHVVYSGLNLSEIPFNSEFEKGDILKLISVGRPHWIKGYSYALKTCAHLKEKGLDFNYKIIGAGQHEELIYLRDYYGLTTSVEFLDILPQNGMFEVLKKSDVMLLTSLEEGIANVAIESMALGTLIVSSDCGGMSELIENGIEGSVVPKRSPGAMAQAIIDLNRKSHIELDTIRKRARKKVEHLFKESKMVEDMERLYKACLNEDS